MACLETARFRLKSALYSISYFKGISEQVGIPYQSLINLYLRDCAAHSRKLNLRWK